MSLAFCELIFNLAIKTMFGPPCLYCTVWVFSDQIRVVPGDDCLSEGLKLHIQFEAFPFAVAHLVVGGIRRSISSNFIS